MLYEVTPLKGAPMAPFVLVGAVQLTLKEVRVSPNTVGIPTASGVDLGTMIEAHPFAKSDGGEGGHEQ